MGILEKILEKVERIDKVLSTVQLPPAEVLQDCKKEQVIFSMLREQIEHSRSELPFSMEVKDVAEILGVSDKSQIYRILAKSGIPGAKKIPGIGWRISRDVFLSWFYGDKFFEENIKGNQ